MEDTVILSTYLIRKGNPQGGSSYTANNYDLMQKWYPALGKGVIFHDCLSNDFIDDFPATKFVKVTKYPYSANDGRFYLFYQYLKKNKHIKTVFMTDLFDVKINCLPEVKPDTLYVQREPRVQKGTKTFWRADWSWAKHQFDKVGGYEHLGLIGKSIYNPGVWGGSRELVMCILEEMLEAFKDYEVEEKNANMVIFNQVIYTLFSPQDIVSGYPLHSDFKSFDINSEACFIHK